MVNKEENLTRMEDESLANERGRISNLKTITNVLSGLVQNMLRANSSVEYYVKELNEIGETIEHLDIIKIKNELLVYKYYIDDLIKKYSDEAEGWTKKYWEMVEKYTKLNSNPEITPQFIE